MKYDGSEIAKYSPLEGSRIEGEAAMLYAHQLLQRQRAEGLCADAIVCPQDHWKRDVFH
jgi:hypothetical protein